MLWLLSTANLDAITVGLTFMEFLLVKKHASLLINVISLSGLPFPALISKCCFLNNLIINAVLTSQNIIWME